MSYNRYKKIINMYTLLLLTFFTCKHRDPKEKPPIAWSRGHLNSFACTLHTSQGNQMGAGGHQKVPQRASARWFLGHMWILPQGAGSALWEMSKLTLPTTHPPGRWCRSTRLLANRFNQR